MPSQKKPFAPDEKKRLIMALNKMPPKQRERLMKLEALRRGIDLPTKKT